MIKKTSERKKRRDASHTGENIRENASKIKIVTSRVTISF